MKLRSRIAVVVVILAIAVWWGAARLRAPAPAADPAAPAAAASTDAASASRDGHIPDLAAPGRAARLSLGAIRSDGNVTISGRVVEYRPPQKPIGGVEVVFRSAAGETSTTARPDGGYTIRVPAGAYGAFVRDDAVLSVGRGEGTRLPGPASADIAGVPDEALMTRVTAAADTDGVDLTAMRGGIVSGRVIDLAGHAVAGAAIRARNRSGMRPTMATDLAESASDGSFELRLPEGGYELDAAHPKFAGLADSSAAQISVTAGGRVTATIALTAGCIITGRVAAPDGSNTTDGAIERQAGPNPTDYVPVGRIESDGSFRWTTTEPGDITLRAWPWKSPPSAARRFTCSDGARFSDVVLQTPEHSPDIEGVLVDHAGHPVSFAYIDLAPLDQTGMNQQERTDATGHWAVYDMPAGRYRITAQAGARGIVTSTIVAPRDGIRLELGGSGRLEGTTSRLPSGSFELVLGSCVESSGKIGLPPSRRLVTVSGGRFTIDDLPACDLAFATIWHGYPQWRQLAIPPSGTAHVDLDIGPPRTKTVHGIVRDASGRPVPDAIVSAARSGGRNTIARTDSTGAYSLETSSGAFLRATETGRIGTAEVGGANIDAEQVDIVINPDASGSDSQD